MTHASRTFFVAPDFSSLCEFELNMKTYNQCNHIANDADATSNKRNRLGSQEHPIGVAVIAAIIALTLTGTHYLPKSPNNNAAISSLPGYNLLLSGNNVGISS